VGDLMSELTNDQGWKVSAREQNARRVLCALGYRAVTRRLSTGGWMHSISHIETGKLRVASIHPDIYESMAVCYTLNKFEEEEG
jgi:hypothetical protein